MSKVTFVIEVEYPYPGELTPEDVKLPLCRIRKELQRISEADILRLADDRDPHWNTQYYALLGGKKVKE